MGAHCLKVLYAIGALVLVALAAREIRKHGDLEDRAETAELRADSATLYAYQIDQERKADSVRYAKDRQRWADSTGALLARADRAAKARPAVVTRLIEVAGDSAAVVRAVTELESLHAIEVSALRNALVVKDSTIRSRELELADADYAIGQYRKALGAARDEASAWERASKGGGLFGIRVSPEIAFGGGVLATLGALVVLR